MKCEQCNQRLSAYLDGNEGERSRIAIERHLAECRRCRQDLRELRQAVILLRNAPSHEARDGFWGRALDQATTPGHRATMTRRRFRFAGAMTVLAVAAATLFTLKPAGKRIEPFARLSDSRSASINAASLISLHTRERAMAPFADIGKIRFAGTEAEANDVRDDGRLDVQ